MSSVDVSVDGDLILCTIEQLDIDGIIMDNGIKNEATVSMDYITDQSIRDKFIGVKLADVFPLNIMKAFKNHSDLAAMLNIDPLVLNNLNIQIELKY